MICQKSGKAEARRAESGCLSRRPGEPAALCSSPGLLFFPLMTVPSWFTSPGHTAPSSPQTRGSVGSYQPPCLPTHANNSKTKCHCFLRNITTLWSAWVGMKQPTRELYVVGPMGVFQPKECAWVAYGLCGNRFQPATSERHRHPQGSTGRAIYLLSTERPRGDFENQTKTNQTKPEASLSEND